MAKVIKSNPMTGVKITKAVSVSDAYSNFLRVKKLSCAENTMLIYSEMGMRNVVPQLKAITGNDMRNVTSDDLRNILKDYAIDHDNGGVVFLWRHMRTFINWVWDEYEFPYPNPTLKVRVKKEAQPPKDGISQDEIDKLLKAIKEHSQFPERDVAFVMLLADTGIRKSSIANLQMKDVNIDRCEITVFEKDQSFHIHPFGASTGKAIRKYLNCLEDVRPDDPFWLCMDGKQLEYVGMREILRRGCAAAKIPMHHFHDFRRYYALQLYNQTHDIYVVSRALDHKSIEVTKRYLAIDNRESAEECRSLSPMDRVTKQTRIKVQRAYV